MTSTARAPGFPLRVHPLVPTALLGFASGLPLYLTGSTLKTWLSKAGVDINAIGLMGVVAMPYALKFLWAPVLDRYVLPVMGRRRGWLLLSQITLALLLMAMGRCRPEVGAWGLCLLALGVSFSSASQDIVYDAWRAEAFRPEDLGMANAVGVAAYRLAMLVSGGLALVLVERACWGWNATYMAMGLLVLVGCVGTLLALGTDRLARPPRTLRQAYEAPFRELAARPGILELLAFCILYKLGDQMAEAMNSVFLTRGMGFSLTAIGLTLKTVGLTCIILGGILGGLVMRKLDLKRALFLFGILQATSVLAFWALSRGGPDIARLALALALENLSYGMGGTALVTLMMQGCDKRFTAAQFALMSSITAVSRSFLSIPSGWLAEHLGWSGYYLFCVGCAVPGILLLLRFERWGRPAPSEAP